MTVSEAEFVWPAAFGVVRNPFSLDRSSAGSSGGPAAGAAASYAMISMGTDTGNSIRGPSGHQGLVGLRSSIGQTSRCVTPVTALTARTCSCICLQQYMLIRKVSRVCSWFQCPRLLRSSIAVLLHSYWAHLHVCYSTCCTQDTQLPCTHSPCCTSLHLLWSFKALRCEIQLTAFAEHLYPPDLDYSDCTHRHTHRPDQEVFSL